MIFKPHDYQSYCIEYIKAHPIAALLLDMGLGKTVITLTAVRDLMLDTCEVNKVLVIAPLRVARDAFSKFMIIDGHCVPRFPGAHIRHDIITSKKNT